MSGNELSQRTAVFGTVVVEAVLVYLAFLGWDRQVDVDPSGSTSGPYETWQVVGSTLALGALAFAGGRQERAWTTALATTLGFTVAWSVGAATAERADAGLWPVGAVLTAIGTFAWTLLIALVVQRRSRPTRTPVPQR